MSASSSRRRALLALLAACLLGSAARAQGDAGADRLEALRAEVASAETALDALERSSSAELEALRAERRQLAQALLELSMSEVTGARADAGVAAAERAERALALRLDEIEAVLGATQSALERVVFAARGVPGLADVSRSAREEALRVATAREGLPAAAELLDAAAAGEDPALSLGLQGVESALDLLGDGLDAADEVRLVEATIRTAGGREETVELLRAGWSAFAYRTADGRVGLSLASPVDAEGYRWSEALAPSTAAAVVAAFEAARTGAAVALPLDPTGQVRPSSLAARQSLSERLADGGPLMVPLALVAAAALLLALERVFTLFLRNRRSHGFAHHVLGLAEEDKLDEAREACGASSGIVPRTLGACLARAAQGKAAMEDAVQSQLFEELPRVTRFLRTLAILAAVAPLVGLLGTVTGIIQTFGVIKALGTTDPTLMAGGISVALVTTAAGLSVAIPTMLAQGLLRGRGDRLIADAERYAAALLTVVAHGGRGPQEGEPV